MVPLAIFLKNGWSLSRGGAAEQNWNEVRDAKCEKQFPHGLDPAPRCPWESEEQLRIAQISSKKHSDEPEYKVENHEEKKRASNKQLNDRCDVENQCASRQEKASERKKSFFGHSLTPA
jgi:hypothetical protein